MRKLFTYIFVTILILSIEIYFAASKEFIFSPDDLKVKIGLALSGGGARGIAQIGVLKVLEENGIEISYIAGTSIGAFVGGLLAVGYSPAELQEIAISTKWDDVLVLLKEQERSELFFDQKVIQDRTLASLRFKNFKFVYPQALSLGWRFNSFIQKLIWNGAYYSNNFDNLKYPFRAIATDVSSGKTISIDKGNLVTALRASSAIPLRNTPIFIDSLILVDGGLFANIPVEQVKEFNPDIVIAINTTSPPLEKEELQKPWSLASQIVNIFMDKFNNTSSTKADILIQPDIGKHSNDNFKGLDSLVLKGEIAAKEKIKFIDSIVKHKRDSIISNIQNSIANQFNLSQNFRVIENPKKQNYSFFLQNDSSGISFRDFLNSLNLSMISKFKIFNLSNFSKDSKEDLVLLEIDTFPQITRISYQFNNANVNHQIDTILKSLIGEYDSPGTRKHLIERIRKTCAQNGYSFVKVSISPEYFSDTLHIKITPNRIGKIKIDSKITTSEYIIRRELALRENEITNGNQVVQSWSNLISTGLFSDVFIDFHLDTNELSCNLKIYAQERGTQVLNLLLRIDNERNLQGGFDFIYENLFNSGTRLLLSTAGGKSDLISKVGLTQTRIWKTDFTFSIESSYIWKLIPIFIRTKTSKLNHYESSVEKEISAEKFGTTLSIGTQIERLGNFFFNFRAEKQRYYNSEETSKPPFYNFYTLKIGLIYDSRNRLEFPSEGRLLNIFLETPLFKTTSSISFTKAFFQHSINYPMKDLVIRPTVTFGFADIGLPFPEFFSMGGEDNFFGFYQDEFLGRQIFSAQLQIQYRLPWKLFFDTYITFGYNLGSVWSQFDSIRISELKHGVGISLGLSTPIGPVTFTLGKAFFFLKNPKTTVWGPFIPYFSIGNRLY